MSDLDFRTVNFDRPTIEDVSAKYEQIWAAMAATDSVAGDVAGVKAWDKLRREIDSWSAHVHLKFEKDTADADAKSALEYRDTLAPKLTDLEVKMKRKLLDSPRRAEIANEIGELAFKLWEVDVLTFDPKIEADLIKEAELEQQFGELIASAKIEFEGETINLSEITKYSQEPDRDLRYRAEKAKWSWFEANGDKFDAIFDSLVKLRTGMAQKLGMKNYVELGYKRMRRVDYSRADVESFRAEVVRLIVPLIKKIRKQQQDTLGISAEDFSAWDEGVYDLVGNPKPQGDHDWMVERAVEMFDELGGGLGEFFRLMNDSHLMDLKTRPTKATGGFCTSFPTLGVPYIFANFNGTKGDVEVFTHEIGHAFQCYMSRTQPLAEYLWPTYESCEIHSMGLEFMTYPKMEKFFGEEGGGRFRKIHLTESLLLLAYICSVDHFQHLIYENPDATPEERKQMWLEMESIYAPGRNWGDLTYPAGGGRWQMQRHIFLSPFYYIDYGLAQVCALQLWTAAEEDFSSTLDRYVALCKRGGEAPFSELVKGCELTLPFEMGCLEGVVQRAEAELGV
jgi:M3 family oligoendopeptidase